MPALKRNEGQLELSLSGSPDFQQALARVRAISGRRFDGDRKLWLLPDDPAVAERVLLTIKPSADKSLLQWVRSSRAERDAELTTAIPDDAQITSPQGHRLYDFQRSGVEFIANHPAMLLGDDMGLGKEQSVLTPVLTPAGWSTLGDLSTGDYVVAQSGDPTKVTGVFPQGKKKLYRVTFNDGSSTLAGEEHLWSVKTPNDWFRQAPWRTKPTKELFPVKEESGNRRWSIPLVEPVSFAKQSSLLPIHPYFLGVLLGDGSFRGTSTPRIVCHDREIIDYCQAQTSDVFREHGVNAYSICGSNTTKILRKLGLWGKKSTEKFIPEIYLRASVTERMQLLQGLMDTDGYNQNSSMQGSASAEIAISCPALASGIQELIWSLGGTARRRIKKTSHKDSQRIIVKLPIKMNPFRLKRKAARYTERTKYPLRARYIESIEYECTEEAVCIAVDDLQQLYVTEDYIVTHNTVQALVGVHELTLTKDQFQPQLPRLVICPNSAKGVWKREIRKWLGEDESFVVVDGNLTPKKRLAQIEKGIADNAWVIVNWEQVRAQKTIEPLTINHRDGSVSTREHVSWQLKQPIFEETQWLAVIADECHRAKNPKAQTARGLWKIDAPIKLALSGTPLQNHPGELWSILRWLYPDQYHENGKTHNKIAWAYWPFYDEYVEDYDTGYRREVVGVKNPDALRFELKERLVRRTKRDKLGLPEKVREYVPVKLNKKQRVLYNEAEQNFWLEIEQAIKEGDKQAARFAEAVVSGKKKIFEIPNGAARTVRLRQIASSPALLGGPDDSAKLDAAVEIILDAQPKQFVVFTEFVQTSNLLVARLREKKLTSNAFTGEVKDTNVRTQMEDDFQTGDIDVLVGTLAAMRESITLTAADTAIFTERAWVPSWNEQAEDRLWRKGQKNQVTILILEGEETVDEDKVRPTNAIKEAIVSSVIQKDEVREIA